MAQKKELGHNHPAAAMAAKSASVIQASQWAVRVCLATFRSCNWPNVHSSTISGFPVLSKRLGVIHGYVRWRKVCQCLRIQIK